MADVFADKKGTCTAFYVYFLKNLNGTEHNLQMEFFIVRMLKTK